MNDRNPSDYILIQKRESQLWWLAVLVMMMLALALYFVDSVNMPMGWWISPEIKFALNTKFVRVSLILAVLLICAYFRESARALRMENLRLITDLQQRSSQFEKKNHELSKLNELSDKLIKTSDSRTALDLIIGAAVELVHADTASIMLKNKQNDILYIAASHGLPKTVVESSSVRIGESLAGMVARDNKPMIIHSDEVAPEVARFANRKGYVESSALIPIQLSGEVQGVFSVARRRGNGRLNDDDIGSLSTLANQIAPVIEKMALLRSLKDQVEMLEVALHELEQAQAEVVQAEKLASIGQLAGGVAHEINNPLQVIMGRSELLLLDETNERKKQDLETITSHTTRIAEIVANLLNFSRQTKEASFRSVDINDVVHTSLQLLEHQMTIDDIEVNRDLQGDLQPVHGDPRQIQQVLTNLIQNAYQSLKDKGNGQLLIKTHGTQDEVVVEVNDNGPGIPEDAINHVFEPFFTTKPEGKGTGLGLSVSYGIIQAHSGQIHVESKVGESTTFTIQLPSEKALQRIQNGKAELKAA